MHMIDFSNQVKKQLTRHLSEGQRVELSSVWKNNGIKEEALSIVEPGINVSPTIYLEPFYKRFQNGESIQTLADEIFEIHKSCSKQQSLDITSFTAYQHAKKRIVYKLVNYEQNRELLEKIPHRRYLDLAIVYYYIFEDSVMENATILLHNSHLKMWNVTEEEVYKTACKNTPKLLPASIVGMHELLKNMLGEVPLEEETGDLCPMYVMTNDHKMNGAATMTYPHVIRDFAESIGENMFIIPSSVHELILVPETGTERGFLNDMVREVNETQVDPKEVLADHVYFYDRKEDHISLCVRESVEYC